MNLLGIGPQVSRDTKPLRLCFCAFPWATEAGHIHPLTISRLLKEVTEHIWIIAGLSPGQVEGSTIKICHLKSARYIRSSGRPLWLEIAPWLYNYLYLQVEMSYHLVRLARRVDVVLLYEGPHYILPALTARLLGKTVVKYLPATVAASSTGKSHFLDRLSTSVFRLSDRIVLALSHRIVVPTRKHDSLSERVSSRRNVSEAMFACIDERFRETKAWHRRDDVVGYVGRLMEVKGVLQLARAIPLILERRRVSILIVGDGILMPQLKEYLDEAGCLDSVCFTGWVPEDMVPHYMNEMKFHVLPSYHDFPGMVNLEAMACGAVAIANRVGSVPDVVIDGETGFLMDGNEPETIARRLIEVWDHPRLEVVRRQGMAFAREHYGTLKVVAAWASVFDAGRPGD